MIDGTGTTTYVHDNADRLTSTTAPATSTVGYGYDGAGRRTSLTYPSGRQVTYGYTNRGELASVTAWTVGTTSYSYDSAGRLSSIALPNGVTSTLSYDIADWLTRLTHARGMTTLEDIQYVLNAVGNRTQMTDSAGTTSWTYDALDRLTNASYPNGDAVAYGYDAVGNRVSHTINGVPKMNTFDLANRMTASGSDTYSFDANGNQLTKTSGGTTTTYAYDALDRLTGITGPVTASYTSNGDGLRVRKVTGGTTTTYAWDVLGLPVVLSDGDEYVWGHGLIGRVAAGTTATYAQADGLGSVRLLTDGTGAVVGTRQYDAFGAARAQTGISLPFGYTGEQEDAESGLVYLRARYLDPSSGRFISEDPVAGGLAEPLSLHAYTYVWNSPLVWVDPTGEDPDQPLFAPGPGGGIGGGLGGSPRGPRLPRVLPGQLRLPGFDIPSVRPSGGAEPHRHHVIPKEILRQLPPIIRRAVQGRPGARNVWEIPAELHRRIHGGHGRERYNVRWKEEYERLTPNEITPQKLWEIRDRIVDWCGLGPYRQ
jgi:RHS repeat-associated protein